MIYHGFEPLSGQTKDYEFVIWGSGLGKIQTMKLVFPLSTQHEGVKTKTGWLGVDRAPYYFCELAL